MMSLEKNISILVELKIPIPLDVFSLHQLSKKIKIMRTVKLGAKGSEVYYLNELLLKLKYNA
ncbi:hypothetical protein ACFFLS_20680 [Flavobacterium procerum]|uniref:Uncharacterized protein n=1 Tax=Flavobacterium procerum TaxID=1455569 RepID=A0ABV6BVL8_9FLAO